MGEVILWETYIPIFVALLALIGTVYTANANRGKMDKSEAVSLESRLKDIEANQKLMQAGIDNIKENMITAEQKECLLVLNERVDTILKGLGTFVPSSLKNPAGLDSVLDMLSDKARIGGWNAVIDYVKHDLDAEKRTDLLAYLEKVSHDKRYTQKRYWSILYLGLLRLELERNDEEPVCAHAA